MARRGRQDSITKARKSMNITLTLAWWQVPIAIALLSVFIEVWIELDETKEPLNYKKHVHRRLGIAYFSIVGMLWARYL